MTSTPSSPDPTTRAQDVAAPGDATAWLTMPNEPDEDGLDGGGYWTNDEVAIRHARDAGHTVLPVDIAPDGTRAVRGVTGAAPLADVMRLAAELNYLHVRFLQLVSYLEAAASGEGVDLRDLSDLR